MRSIPFIVVLAACGGDAAPDARPPIDARQPDFSCADDVFPDPVPDPIVLGGEVYEPGLTGTAQDEPVAGADVRAYDLTETNQLASATSGADGRYELSLATGGDPLNTLVRAAQIGYLDSTAWLPTAAFESRDDIDLALFTQQHVDTVMSFAGVDPDPDKGILIVKLFDCEAVPIEGATISIDPPPLDALYVTATGLPSYQHQTSIQGSAILLDVEAASVRIDAELDGRPLRSNTVIVEPLSSDTVTTAGVVP